MWWPFPPKEPPAPKDSAPEASDEFSSSDGRLLLLWMEGVLKALLKVAFPPGGAAAVGATAAERGVDEARALSVAIPCADEEGPIEADPIDVPEEKREIEVLRLRYSIGRDDGRNGRTETIFEFRLRS